MSNACDHTHLATIGMPSNSFYDYREYRTPGTGVHCEGCHLSFIVGDSGEEGQANLDISSDIYGPLTIVSKLIVDDYGRVQVSHLDGSTQWIFDYTPEGHYESLEVLKLSLTPSYQAWLASPLTALTYEEFIAEQERMLHPRVRP